VDTGHDVCAIGLGAGDRHVQRGSDLVIRADVPVLSKEDIAVDIAYRSERSYGSFCHMVPLPQGSIADSAKATFNNGVLEIVVQASSFDVRRGRRIEIKEGTSEQKSGQQNPKM
jgi:HSP20 family molecular chaperone IbpA